MQYDIHCNGGVGEDDESKELDESTWKDEEVGVGCMYCVVTFNRL